MNPSSLPTGSVAVILPAAGSGQRFGRERNKLFALLAGKPLWTYAAETLSRRDDVGIVLLAVAPSDQKAFQDQLSILTVPERVRIVVGGEQRSDTVAAAIDALSDTLSDTLSDAPLGTLPQFRWVAVHDAARPLIRNDDITAVFDQAALCGAAILATPITGTLKRQASGDANTLACQTVDRRGIWQALTPQVFQVDLLRQAYARHRGRSATDDAEIVERMGHPVRLVQGAADNLKITYPEDLRLAEALMNAVSMQATAAGSSAHSLS